MQCSAAHFESWVIFGSCVVQRCRRRRWETFGRNAMTSLVEIQIAPPRRNHVVGAARYDVRAQFVAPFQSCMENFGLSQPNNGNAALIPGFRFVPKEPGYNLRLTCQNPTHRMHLASALHGEARFCRYADVDYVIHILYEPIPPCRVMAAFHSVSHSFMSRHDVTRRIMQRQHASN